MTGGAGPQKQQRRLGKQSCPSGHVASHTIPTEGWVVWPQPNPAAPIRVLPLACFRHTGIPSLFLALPTLHLALSC